MEKKKSNRPRDRNIRMQKQRATKQSVRQQERGTHGAPTSVDDSTLKRKKQYQRNMKHTPQSVTTEQTSDITPENISQRQPIVENPSDEALSVIEVGDTPLSPSKKSAKLKFGEKDKPPPKAGQKMVKAQKKAARSEEKLDSAQKKLPKKRRIKFDKVDGVTDDGKPPKRKLRFEAEVKSQRDHIKGPVATRPVKFGANVAIGFAHKKLFEVQHENVGTQAAHKGELIAEGVLRKGYRMHKTRPYRKVEKLTRKTTKLNVKADYRKALNDNPKFKSNVFSRMAQKRKIKKQYAKAARNGKKAALQAKKVGTIVSKAVGAVVKNPVVLKILLILFLLIILISAIFSACSGLMSNMGSTILSTSYLADEIDIDNASILYTEWETDLRIYINNIEANHPGFDEYRFSVDNIGHNQFELMAYLTAVYDDFSGVNINSVLQQIFVEQYQLSLVSSVEVRTRMVAQTDADGNSYQVEESYEWHVLTVTLTSRPFFEVIFPRMNAEQRQRYNLLMDSNGNRMLIGSPFRFNWVPYISSHYGYRIHPITGARAFHTGIDIALPTGTEILAGGTGVVQFAGDNGGYGLTVVIDYGNGITALYAHCSQLLVSVGQTVNRGDVIALVGSTGNSTGPHLHLEVMRNGRRLNPLFFAETNSAGGRSNWSYGNAPAMSAETFAILLAEAESHLGKPYVYGASGPNAFDCSSFICWIYTHSGVVNLPRTTAQGIFNQFVPIRRSQAMPGDLIFFTETYSTTDMVTHVGLYVGNGRMIHAGSPIQYASINTAFWQNHFYAFGRVPAN